MAEKFQREANEILGRPLKITFWHEGAAKTIVETNEKLENLGVPYEVACEIILGIWNSACEECGD